MKTDQHIKITKVALEEFFSKQGLGEIIAANIGQDDLKYQFGHDHFHYDNNSFAKADAYVLQLREECAYRIKKRDLRGARQSFGKLTHTVQDFYAHSNYIEIMLSKLTEPSQIQVREPGDSLPEEIISGKLYYPLEAITFIPKISKRISYLFPPDSHARLNKDDPEKPNYHQAYRLAVAATTQELGRITEHLSDDDKWSFFDKAIEKSNN